MTLNFKNRISIVELEPNPGPEPGESEQEFTKAWADIKTMKGTEYNQSVIAGNIGISRFIIRFIPNIKPNMKVRYKGNLYDIESITNDDEGNRTITIIGKAILNNG
ncbi:phage head closure protein [Cytobacillus kochii]|uniref:Head-tail adaptor protein n=1 Tax=Cytobacillus kochii TaxID=859143 RepID=A0A248TGA5_9BACI|nr:phage head closure protein [Cytobacillus kochii]ASV67221.1 hypothetical protein CKF48_07690 [Cytobacillus kochii]